LLNIPQPQVTQFQYQYWKLIGQDKLVTLHSLLGSRIFSFYKLYEELIIKNEMSIERVANLVETYLYKLLYVESLYERACRAVARKREEIDYLENRTHVLKEEKSSRMVTLPSNHYHYENDRETSSTSSSLPYWPPENYDPWSEYKNKPKKNSIEKDEIHEMYEGDIVP
jgi:hypothetical protein